METELIKSTLQGHELYSLVNKDSGNLFSFLPGLGCCLNELELSGRKIFRNIDPNDFDEMVHKAFNGTQLFPFPNRLANGIYSWKGKEYSFELNDQGRPNALHGLLSKKKFDVTHKEGRVATKYEYRKDDQGYPFDIDIINEFQLNERSFEIVTQIKNVGVTEAPVGHGWHPYFNGLEKIDHCKIAIPSTSQLVVDENLIPTGEVKDFKEFSKLELIDRASFDSCINECKSYIELENSNEGFLLHLSSKGYPFTQLFMPPTRDSIAIEPQTCAPNAFNNGLGLIELNPMEERKFSFRIELQA